MDYLIPANSKKGQLYFSIFKGIDLIILLAGALLTLLSFFIVKGEGLSAIFGKLFPILTALLLVIPIPYYHNVRVFIKEMFIYLRGQKRYDWKGWCVRYVGDIQESKSNSNQS